MYFLVLKLIFPYIIGNRYDGKVYNSCLSITFKVIQIFKMYYIQYMLQICDSLYRLVMGFVLIAEVCQLFTFMMRGFVGGDSYQ